jgi:hypothetical protein
MDFFLSVAVLHAPRPTLAVRLDLFVGVNELWAVAVFVVIVI